MTESKVESAGAEAPTQTAWEKVRQRHFEARRDIKRISEEVAQGIIDAGGQTESLEDFLVAIAGNCILEDDNEHVKTYQDIYKALERKAGQPVLFVNGESGLIGGGILAPEDKSGSGDVSTRFVVEYAYSPADISGRRGELYIELAERLDAGGGLIHTLDGDDRMWFAVASTTTDEGRYTSSWQMLVGYEAMVTSGIAQAHPDKLAESLEELFKKVQK